MIVPTRSALAADDGTRKLGEITDAGKNCVLAWRITEGGRRISLGQYFDRRSAMRAVLHRESGPPPPEPA